MPDFNSLVSFAIASVALLVIPGPAVIYIVNRSVANGRSIGLASVLGLELGTFMHVLAATVGLSAILATSENAFNIVKYLGASYLVLVGLRTISRQPQVVDSSADAMTKVQAFRQGFIINTLNPKVALFFLSFLPQFIDPEKSSNALQSLSLGAVFVICGFVTDGIYALTASSLRETLVKGKALPFIQRYVAGVVFVLLGVVAATAKIS
ncbi:MAG: LysE family translocator [Actinobacteria bacterium]|nr:LysE family translocator [Actinomycetota bacterium]NCU80592.1 LysE family translocator [Acidimicrobiia bacterium]NDC99306.1 LysE family translocator [bacterium]NCU87409.1 LysE family translocator [Actinomycetota bacterium]NDA96550.1 LysE family translocator [Actinomycetota bacterium]